MPQNVSQRSTRPTSTTPSARSSATEMTKAVNGLQSLSIMDTRQGAQTGSSTTAQDGFTTVQHTKAKKSSSQVKSFKAVKEQGVPLNPQYQKESNLSASLSPPRTNGRGRSTFDPQKLGSILEKPSAAATSRLSAYSSNNWRASTVPRPVYHDPDNKHNGNFKKVYPKNFYQIGMIIQAALHEDDFRATNSTMTEDTVADKNITESVHGRIHTKYRKMIVIACYERNYIAIPLFTHNGRGLDNKNPDEYISVRDHRDRAAEFRELSKHGHLLTEYIHSGIRYLDPKSTAHITYPLSRKYDLAVVHEGHLRASAANHLVMLFNKFAAKALPSAH